MKLSVIIISYKSEKLLKELLHKIPSRYQITIIENSLLQTTKKNIEKKFKNTKVIIPSTNLGYASAFNLAFSKCINNFILMITPDVKISNKMIVRVEKFVKSFQKFTVLAPVYRNQKIHKNFNLLSSTNNKIKVLGYNLLKVKEIDGCLFLLNKKKLKKTKILDENFFLYFETTDFCLNLIKKKHNLYVINEIKFEHLGTSSSDKKYKYYIDLNRNWHYAWSKFYFFKKNFNYLYALRKVIPNIYQGLIGALLSILKLKFTETNLHFASVLGSINAIFLRKPYYRPKIK